MSQLSIFENVPVCHHCHQIAVKSEKNSILYDGFTDIALKIFVCWGCYDVHEEYKLTANYEAIN